MNVSEKLLINYAKQIKVTLGVIFSTIYHWALY